MSNLRIFSVIGFFNVLALSPCWATHLTMKEKWKVGQAALKVSHGRPLSEVPANYALGKKILKQNKKHKADHVTTLSSVKMESKSKSNSNKESVPPNTGNTLNNIRIDGKN